MRGREIYDTARGRCSIERQARRPLLRVRSDRLGTDPCCRLRQIVRTGCCSAYVRIYQERIRAVSNLSELIDLNLIDRIVAALGTEQEMRRWDLFVFSSGRRGMNSWLRRALFFSEKGFVRASRQGLRACVYVRRGLLVQRGSCSTLAGPP